MHPAGELTIFGFKLRDYAAEYEKRDAEGRTELAMELGEQAGRTLEGIEKIIDKKIEAALKEVREEWRVLGDRLWDGS